MIRNVSGWLTIETWPDISVHPLERGEHVHRKRVGAPEEDDAWEAAGLVDHLTDFLVTGKESESREGPGEGVVPVHGCHRLILVIIVSAYCVKSVQEETAVEMAAHLVLTKFVQY